MCVWLTTTSCSWLITGRNEWRGRHQLGSDLVFGITANWPHQTAEMLTSSGPMSSHFAPRIHSETYFSHIVSSLYAVEANIASLLFSPLFRQSNIRASSKTQAPASWTAKVNFLGILQVFGKYWALADQNKVKQGFLKGELLYFFYFPSLFYIDSCASWKFYIYIIHSITVSFGP